MPAAYTEFLQNVQREIISPIITLIGLVAFVIFVWGVVDFIMHADNQEKRDTGKRHMIWGLVGMVVLFGANAILAILTATVN